MAQDRVGPDGVGGKSKAGLGEHVGSFFVAKIVDAYGRQAQQFGSEAVSFLGGLNCPFNPSADLGPDTAGRRPKGDRQDESNGSVDIVVGDGRGVSGAQIVPVPFEQV
jgi:hypothetical protein